ncbi:MAG: hypothetical protein L6R39_002002 [Caloplaca ligustica]|nr:MAG: hypothetical protein L6R39_002002 [Caloplaca ligustica]
MKLLLNLLVVLPSLGPALSLPSGNFGSAANVHGKVPTVLGRRSPNIPSPHVIQLSRETSVTSARSRHSKSLQKADHGNKTVGLAPLIAYQDIVYFTEITFGTQTFKAVVDTGSSDTWLVQSGFQCLDVRDKVTVPEAECAFGPTYAPSSTFKQIPGENFNISYTDGEFLTGILGSEVVTLGGITVKNQEFALVDYAAWNGDNSSSGLIGLAFPNLTSAFTGSDPTLDSDSNAVPYNPIFTNMYTQGLVPPVFSLAVSRDENSGGLLALGGLPPVRHSSYFACAPFETGPATDLSGTGNPVYQFYYINVDGVTHGNTSEKVDLVAVVDSGTSLIFLPPTMAYSVNKQFIPLAHIDLTRGEFAVDCNAKAPRFGISIANHTFYVNPKDMVIKTQDGTCISGVTIAGYGQPTILGDVFLKNVLAVFDIGASEMRFAARDNL